MSTKITKADLIAALVEQGRGTAASLRRVTLAELQAMAADATAVPSGPLTIPAGEVQVGDVWPGGVKITKVRAGKKWTYLYSKKNADYSMEILTDLLVTVTR